MAISLNKGHRVKLDHVDVFADGVAIKQPGAECFNICRALCDGILLVNNAATSAAVKDVFNETRAILEPAGAVALAGARDYLQTRPDIQAGILFTFLYISLPLSPSPCSPFPTGPTPLLTCLSLSFRLFPALQ